MSRYYLIFHNLHFFANPVMKNVPDKNDPDVTWFGPGIHEFENDKFPVPSGRTVYVDGSAILRRQLLIHDCTTVYTTRKGFTGGCKNITMQNSTLWADMVHPIMIGIHGNSENPDVIQNLKYTNIDILDHKEMQVDYQGCMTINAGDNNLIRDVLFENKRVEDFCEGQLVNLRIFYNKKHCTAPGLRSENVTFHNIEYNGDNANLSIITGYNKDRKVKDIAFEN